MYYKTLANQSNPKIHSPNNVQCCVYEVQTVYPRSEMTTPYLYPLSHQFCIMTYIFERQSVVPCLNSAFLTSLIWMIFNHVISRGGSCQANCDLIILHLYKLCWQLITIRRNTNIEVCLSIVSVVVLSFIVYCKAMKSLCENNSINTQCLKSKRVKTSAIIGYPVSCNIVCLYIVLFFKYGFVYIR